MIKVTVEVLATVSFVLLGFSVSLTKLSSQVLYQDSSVKTCCRQATSMADMASN